LLQRGKRRRHPPAARGGAAKEESAGRQMANGYNVFYWFVVMAYLFWQMGTAEWVQAVVMWMLSCFMCWFMVCVTNSTTWLHMLHLGGSLPETLALPGGSPAKQTSVNHSKRPYFHARTPRNSPKASQKKYTFCFVPVCLPVGKVVASLGYRARRPRPVRAGETQGLLGTNTPTKACQSQMPSEGLSGAWLQMAFLLNNAWPRGVARSSPRHLWVAGFCGCVCLFLSFGPSRCRTCEFLPGSLFCLCLCLCGCSCV